MEKEFIEWYEKEQSRFHSGQFDEMQMAYAAWLEGKKKDSLIHSVADFANRLATVMLESQSSNTLFFVQQAYEDDGDGLDGLQQSSTELLKTIQTNAQIILQEDK